MEPNSRSPRPQRNNNGPNAEVERHWNIPVPRRMCKLVVLDLSRAPSDMTLGPGSKVITRRITRARTGPGTKLASGIIKRIVL